MTIMKPPQKLITAGKPQPKIKRHWMLSCQMVVRLAVHKWRSAQKVRSEVSLSLKIYFGLIGIS